MGAAGSPHAAFQRALRTRNLTRALTEARDLATVSLADALELLLLIGDQRPDHYGRAAARWLARYTLELRDVDLVEAQLVASALAGLRAQDPRPAVLTLRSLARRRRMTDTENVLRRIG